METGDKPFPILALIAALLTARLIAVDVRIAAADGDLAPLSTVGVPPRIGGTIINNAAAIRLGKALFWDTQTGGDGQIACATCHFHAGAVLRHVNSLRCARNCVAIRSWKSPSSHSTLYAAGIGAT